MENINVDPLKREKLPIDNQMKIIRCIYCEDSNVVKRGVRKNKLENSQLYYCNFCNKSFTSQKVKNKTYPVRIIIEALVFYYQGYNLVETRKYVNEVFGVNLGERTISNWLKEYEDLCTYSRLREYGLNIYSPQNMITIHKMMHKQIYTFRYHQAKAKLLLKAYKHRQFTPIKELLDLAITEVPHQMFAQGLRSSEQKNSFSLDGVRITERSNNYAVRIARFVLEGVSDNKLRHETLQKFMLACDSVTIATEVPIYMNRDDLMHLKEELQFEIPLELDYDSAITGHIDFVQIRNGSIHILDYKPRAAKEKPIDQLTIYALALSRLTGLRLYDFKCAWFDDKNYYEFYPLHVVYKLKKKNNLPKVSKDQLKLELATA